jgi:tetratricopeptide (TPR) repeat protein
MLDERMLRGGPPACRRPTFGSTISFALRKIVTALVAVLFVAVSAAAAGEMSARRIHKASSSTTEGFRALEKGDLSRATELFELALANVPNFPNAHLGLGHVAYARLHYESALVHYTAARDRLRELNELELQRKQREFEDAQLKILEYEDDIYALQNLPGGGDQSQRIRDIERDVLDLKRIQRPTEQAAAEAPAEVFFHRGAALFRLDRIEEALDDWTTCARLDPGFAAVYNNIAAAHWKLGHADDARSALAEAKRRGATVSLDLEKAISGAPGTP